MKQYGDEEMKREMKGSKVYQAKPSENQVQKGGGGGATQCW